MKRTQTGFTLIELVVVIVLLGILGVTALGKFQNLSADAADAAEQGVAAELSSASAINFAARTVDPTTGTAIATADCSDATTVTEPGAALNALMASGSAPVTNYVYTITSGGNVTTEDGACTTGQTFNCSIRNTKGDNTDDAVASIVCTG